ncbi:MAG: response regulator [Methylobacteriaceae bacterium]|nr:response regulator [Methylobacteriaceae bacterium]MCC0001831.1 response regulator [Methylobacteriaceae bacterium]
MRDNASFLDGKSNGDSGSVENERQMATNRMVITTILFGAVSIFGRDHPSMDSGFMAGAYLAFLALAAAFFAHVRIWPRARAWRRVAVLLTDELALSYVAYFAGPAYVGLLYPGYLLIIYGFGFRYGVKWIVASGIMSVVAVAFVVRMSPLWRDNELLGGGLIVGLIIIPAYALNLVRNLWQAKAKAEESARAKSMFVAAVSHDLRTPLNAIIGLGDILAASKLPREEADMARMIGQAGRSLLGQIDSILDFSRLEMSREPAPRAPVDLFEMLHDIRELLDVSAQAKGVRLLLRIDTPAPRWIVANARHVHDSLVNLVGNAIKFTPAGHVEIAVRALRIADGRARLRFEVRDSGIGMGEDEQARIFDRFTQANAEIRETYGGSGLGLAIARQLVSGLGGQIGVSSAKGVGSVFWFEFDAEIAPVSDTSVEPQYAATLLGEDIELVALTQQVGLSVAMASHLSPCDEAAGAKPKDIVIVDLRDRAGAADVDREALLAALGRRGAVFIVDDPQTLDLRSRPAGASVALHWPCNARELADAVFVVSGGQSIEPPQVETMRTPAREIAILVAEDNKTNQKVIGKMLSLAGRQAKIVDDGHAALDLLALERFDVVLMDINMPRVDGIEATRRLRMFERSLGRRTPVIALTADVTDETRARCMAAGIDDCITKPIDLPKLLAAIDRLLNMESSPTLPVQEEVHDDAGEAVAADAREGASVTEDDINAAALADLERLGGPDFVREVASQFVADAALILKELAVAAQQGDVEKFRDEAHALRSCSANVGARSIYRLCLSWRQIGPEEFATEGLAHVRRLEEEYEKARAGLAPYTAEAA